MQDLVPALRAKFGADLHLRVLTSTPIAGLADEEVLCRAPEAVLGLSGALGWKPVLEEVSKLLERDPPDLFIAVSHHGFNLILAAELKANLAATTRSLMIAPPEIWAWDVRLGFRALRPFLLWAAPRLRSVPYVLGAMLDRGRSTLEIFDGIACLLEPNIMAYRQRHGELGGRTLLAKVGHPFARYAHPDAQEQARKAGRSLRANLAPPKGTLLVGLFPGSRKAEVTTLLPIMLDAVDLLHARTAAREGCANGLQFFIAASGDGRAAQIQSLLDQRVRPAGAPQIPVVVDQAEAALSAADFGLLCSGTVTLLAACLGLPSVVAYQRGWSLAKTAVANLVARKGRISTRHGAGKIPFALPSGVLGERIFPEVAMRQCTPDRMATALLELVDTGDARERLEKHQQRLLGLLQPEPPQHGVGSTTDTPMQRAAELGHHLVTTPVSPS